MKSDVLRNNLRRLWSVKPGIAFLNHGSFGACPRPILERQAELRKEMEAEPVQFLWRRYEERLQPSRQILARFLKVNSRDLVFVTNSTTGVNAVARSFPLKAGDEILTTSLNYNACHNVLVEAARASKARLVTALVPFPVADENEVIESILKLVSRRTRLVMLDHVTSDSALILPLTRLIPELKRRRVAVLIDGAHAPGMVDLNLPKLGADFYTGNLHKWVCAPKGAAFLWAHPDRQRFVQPPVISHGNNRQRPGFSSFQDRFDWCGTFDPTAWMCVGETIQWMSKLLPGGWPAIRRRNHQLVLEGRRLLIEQLGLEPPCPERMIGSMSTLPLPARFPNEKSGKIDAEQLALYDRYQIEVPFSRIGPGQRRFFRISAHLHNRLSDYQRLAEAMGQMGVV